MRHFAESVWFPTALLLSRAIVWTAGDDASASATIRDGPISVTLLSGFGAGGLIPSMHADSRAAQLGKSTVMMPWECRMSNYRTQDGMRVSMTGEVLDLTPQGERPCFKGKLETLTFLVAD